MNKSFAHTYGRLNFHCRTGMQWPTESNVILLLLSNNVSREFFLVWCNFWKWFVVPTLCTQTAAQSVAHCVVQKRGVRYKWRFAWWGSRTVPPAQAGWALAGYSLTNVSLFPFRIRVNELIRRLCSTHSFFRLLHPEGSPYQRVDTLLSREMLY